MDLKIQNGDYAVNTENIPRRIYGIEEAAQRAGIILSTPKGAFRYDRSLGADWSGWNGENGPSEGIMVICREAIAGRGDFGLKDVRMILDGTFYRLIYTTCLNSEEITKEVKAVGDLR